MGNSDPVFLCNLIYSENKKKEAGHEELESVIEQLQDLILSLDTISDDQSSDAVLPNSFLMEVKNFAKLNISSR